MKEWVINNTSVTEERQDNLINPTTVIMEGTPKRNCKLSNHSIIKINNFTYKKPTIIRCISYGIIKTKKYYIYKDIKFKVFAELMISKKGNFYKFLYSEKRRGSCFQTSMEICLADENSKLVTAMCVDPFLIPSKKFLHSFVINTFEDGKEYVIDGTLNVVIEKQKYMDIYKAQIISEISGKKIKEFFDFIIENKESKLYFSLPEYFCFPDEIEEGAKKYIKRR